MRLKITLILTILLALGFTSLSASVFMSDKSTIFTRLDSLDDDLYIFGNYGEAYGIIGGDLTAFCYDHEASGIIAGNANIFAYKVLLGGQVNQTARLFGYDVYTDASIGRNLLIFGNEIEIDQQAEIQKDLNCAGDIIYIKGTVHGAVDVSGRIVHITGNIDGDVEIDAEEIYISSPARIGGDLYYTSKAEADIEDDVVIKGRVDWEEPEEKIKTDHFLSSLGIVFHVIFFLMALLTGYFLILIFNRHTHESVNQISSNFWKTMAVGLLSIIIFIGGPIVFCLLIIGIPLAMMLIFLGLVLFYIGKIYASIAIGHLVFKMFTNVRKIALGWEFLVGLIILSIVFRIPGLGTVVYILAFILGSGAAIMGYLSLCKKFGNSSDSQQAADTIQ